MKKAFLPAILLYVLGAAFLCLCTLLDLKLSPPGRVAVIGIFCVVTYFGSRALCKAGAEKTQAIMKSTFAVYFALYLVLLLRFTLFDPMFARTGTGSTVFSSPERLRNYLDNSVNFAPFATIFDYAGAVFTGARSTSAIITNLLGNLIALAPMALFLPILFEKMRKFTPFILATAAAVIAVELLQFVFAAGACDIDDLILNTAGAAGAYALLHLKPVKAVLQKITLLEY